MKKKNKKGSKQARKEGAAQSQAGRQGSFLLDLAMAVTHVVSQSVRK